VKRNLYILRGGWYGICRGNVFYLGRSPAQAIRRAGLGQERLGSYLLK
jgi:hypothetical protein